MMAQIVAAGKTMTPAPFIAQALILNEEGTDFNIILAHNPSAALYPTGSYDARMLRKGF